MSMEKNLKVFREKDLRALKARIHKIERPKKRRSESLTLGLKAIDSTLPEGGIASSAVHEVTGSSGNGFAAFLAGQACRSNQPILWCVEGDSSKMLYGPGLVVFGIKMELLIMARCRGTDEILWAMEEGLREKSIGLVVGGLSKSVSLTASRRLQLAAEAGCTIGLILHDGLSEEIVAPSAVTTRWRVNSLPTLKNGTMNNKTHWGLSLCRCRSVAKKRSWDVEWDNATNTLALVSDAKCGTLASSNKACLKN